MFVKFILALLVFLVPLVCSQTINVTNATFCQLEFLTPNGSVDTEFIGYFDLLLKYVGSTDVYYLNVVVNGEWSIRNVPVLSRGGNETEQEVTYTFGLENRSQDILDEIDYGLELTEDILAVAPNETETATIQQKEVRIGPGGGVKQLPGEPKPPPPPRCPQMPLQGGMQEDGAVKHTNAPYPNAECPTRFCVPAAIANSLKFLNDQHGLGLDMNDIDTAAIGALLGTTTQDGTFYNTWVQKRDKFKDKIDTYTIPETPANEEVPYRATAASLSRRFEGVDLICGLLDKNCVVEMFVLTPTGGFGHAVAIVGIIKLKDGKYSVDVAHDTEQNQNGGTVTETVIWDSNTNRIEGGRGLNCRAVYFLVVECPKKNGGGGMDPHFQTWGGHHFDYHGQCDLVLLSCATFANGLGLDLHVRTTIVGQYSVISHAALQIGSDVLEIRASGMTLLNGETMNDATVQLGGFKVSRKGRCGSRRNVACTEVKIFLSNDDMIVFKAFQGQGMIFVDVKGSFGNFEKSRGLMGKFGTGERVARDGVSTFQWKEPYGKEWQVQSSEPQLFMQQQHPQWPEKCLDSPALAQRRRLRNVGTSTEEAKTACNGVRKDEFEDCVYDVIATDDVAVAGAYLAI